MIREKTMNIEHMLEYEGTKEPLPFVGSVLKNGMLVSLKQNLRLGHAESIEKITWKIV